MISHMSRLTIVLWTYAPKHQVVQNILWVAYLPILNWWCNVVTAVTSTKFTKFSTVHIVSSAWAPSWTLWFLIVIPDELQQGDWSWGNLPSVALSLGFVTPMSEGRDILDLIPYPGTRYYFGYGHGAHVQSMLHEFVSSIITVTWKSETMWVSLIDQCWFNLDRTNVCVL